MLAALSLPAVVAAQPASEASGAPGRVVAARVGDEEILVRDVQRAVTGVVRGRKVAPSAEALIQARMLEQLINRRLVQEHLEEQNLAASEHKVDAALDEFKAKLERQGKTLDALLQQRGMDQAALRSQLAFELSWKKYLAQQLTDEALEDFFDRHRRDYDGSTMSISHILLRPQMSGDPNASARLMAKARALRADIMAGEISFEDAARQHSFGPSRLKGGQLGTIKRRGMMVEAFSRAAFALEPGEISEPVQTQFGVHLIRCREIYPGEKTWTDVRDKLQQPFAQELFARLADAQRKEVSIRYTGQTPYIRPGTTELVVPQR